MVALLEVTDLAQELVTPDVATGAMTPWTALGTPYLIRDSGGSRETEAQDPTAVLMNGNSTVTTDRPHQYRVLFRLLWGGQSHL